MLKNHFQLFANLQDKGWMILIKKIPWVRRTNLHVRNPSNELLKVANGLCVMTFIELRCDCLCLATQGRPYGIEVLVS